MPPFSYIYVCLILILCFLPFILTLGIIKALLRPKSPSRWKSFGLYHPLPKVACFTSLVILRGIGWHLALAQLQRLGLAARQILGSGADGRKRQEREWGTQTGGICE